MIIDGIIIGAITFLIIGIYHPIVIKGEYYFGTGIWPIFLLMGGAGICASLLLPYPILSAVSAVWGFSSFWAIKELFEQKKRVEKGWFPANPKKEAAERKE